jgi:ankyrin repeat protein
MSNRGCIQGLMSAEALQRQQHTERQRSELHQQQDMTRRFHELQDSLHTLEAQGHALNSLINEADGTVPSESRTMQAMAATSQNPIIIPLPRNSSAYLSGVHNSSYPPSGMERPMLPPGGFVSSNEKHAGLLRQQAGFFPFLDRAERGSGTDYAKQSLTNSYSTEAQSSQAVQLLGRRTVVCPRDFLEYQYLALCALAFGFADLLRHIVSVYPHVLVFLQMLRYVPRSMSNLLSDNIILEDFVGQRHSLQYCNFQHWSIVDAMLKIKFDGSPGLEKLESEDFVLEIWRPGTRPVSLRIEDWGRNVQPNTRVTMSAKLSQLRMSNGTCVKCGSATCQVRPEYFTCSNCRISYRTWIFGGGPFMAEVLEQAKRLGPNCLGPTEAQSPALKSPEFESFKERHAVLKNRIKLPKEYYFARPRRAPQELELMKLSEPHRMIVDEVARQHRERRSALRRSRRTPGVSSQRSQLIYNNLQSFLATLSVKTFQSADLWHQIANAKANTVSELDGLDFFRRVSLREIDDLHEASLKGHVTQVMHLLEDNVNLDRVRGIWGTALDAAVLSGSAETVELLLKRGANPLIDKGPLGSSVEIAAFKGYATILERLLARALKVLGLNAIDATGFHARGTEPRKDSALRKVFLDVLNSALYAATKAGHFWTVRILLFYGANPFYIRTDGTRPFQVAYNAGHQDLVEHFVVETCARDLISNEEAHIALLTYAGLNKGGLGGAGNAPFQGSMVGQGDTLLFEEVVRSRMRERRQWSYPYFRQDTTVQGEDITAINRQYDAWLKSSQKISKPVVFETPRIVVS